VVPALAPRPFPWVRPSYACPTKSCEIILRSGSRRLAPPPPTSRGSPTFFDEIGETSPPLQAKLLRALQEREVRPVGGARSRKIDVRVVAATNRSLSADVESSRFREDLFYRLAVFRIDVPPLRERLDDVLRHLSDRLQETLRPLREVVQREGPETLRAQLGRIEAWLLRRALDAHHNRRAATARTLGITHEGLYKKMRRSGIS